MRQDGHEADGQIAQELHRHEVLERAVVQDGDEQILGHGMRIKEPPKVDDHPHGRRFERLVLQPVVIRGRVENVAEDDQIVIPNDRRQNHLT